MVILLSLDIVASNGTSSPFSSPTLKATLFEKSVIVTAPGS